MALIPDKNEGIETVRRFLDELDHPKTVQGAFEVAKRVANFYRHQGCGFVIAPNGGENVVEYAGKLVRAGRVSFEGQTIKILTDVPTTNGAGWDVNEFEPELYLPFEGADENPPLPPPNDEIKELKAKLEVLEAKLDALLAETPAWVEHLTEKIGQLEGKLEGKLDELAGRVAKQEAKQIKTKTRFGIVYDVKFE